MKLSLALTVLAGSAGVTTSFVVDCYHAVARSAITHKNGMIGTDSKSRLHYMDNKAGDDDAVVDLNGVVTDMGVVMGEKNPTDEQLVENLAFSLNMDEALLHTKYQAWLNKYNKTADTSRYFNWKRNFLMQEVWNRTNGESFDLNEFGDYTKKEFNAMNAAGDSQSITMTPTETVPAVTDSDKQTPVEEPLAYYLNDHNTQLQDKPRPKFKQVQTFSGGFRMVPVKEADTKLHAELQKPAQPASVVDNKQDASTTVQGQRFRKVRLFSGGFMIVPNNGKN